MVLNGMVLSTDAVFKYISTVTMRRLLILIMPPKELSLGQNGWQHLL